MKRVNGADVVIDDCVAGPVFDHGQTNYSVTTR